LSEPLRFSDSPQKRRSALLVFPQIKISLSKVMSPQPLSIRKPQKQSSPVTQDQIDQAVAEFFAQGGEVKRLDPTPNFDSRRRVNLERNISGVELDDWDAELEVDL
jgi:hypothetical protein